MTNHIFAEGARLTMNEYDGWQSICGRLARLACWIAAIVIIVYTGW